ncbi:hypothetical protein [Streptomyces sp. NBC_00250]|uniref:hypothetical protein n=1 Tax=Streptomyces sp. NBC_00250 TaxID=2903641 RepID=UPI002E2BEBCD|nr:hypothetical protein [Streptomyces sp. NBC_00250]
MRVDASGRHMITLTSDGLLRPVHGEGGPSHQAQSKLPGARQAPRTAIVRDRLGDPASAEAASFQALAVLPDSIRRNRALTTAT